MQLQQLYDIANLFQSHKIIKYIARLNDNIIIMQLDDIHYCIDLNKANPQVYIDSNTLKSKTYNAPFDIALSKYLYKSNIKKCYVDGMNKILIMECEFKNNYKSLQTTFQLEFINRLTNAIISNNNIIISALRFYNTANRQILPKIKLIKMEQPDFIKHISPKDKQATINELIKNKESRDNMLIEQQRNKILNILNLKLNKLINIFESLPEISSLEQEKEKKTMIANYILLNLDSIKSYTKYISINGNLYEIPEKKKPSMVSDYLFRQVKKIKQKIKHIHIQKENLESKITFLHNQISFTKTANKNELIMLTPPKKESKKEKKKCYENFYIDGIRISIGRNEQENTQLLKDSKADFIWLHIVNIPSSHLIIHANNVNLQILEYAGTLLARLNGIKDNKIVIDYTKRRFIKITQGANVVYSKEKKLHLHISEE